MRPDANKISLRAVRSILDAAKPFGVDVAGTKVLCAVARGEPDPWPERGIPGLDAATDGPLPAAVDVTCEWEGGACVLQVRRSGSQLGLRVRLRQRRTLVWITVPVAIGNAEDGGKVKLRVAVFTFQRKSDAPELGQRLNDAMREVLVESKLPLVSTSAAEVCELEVPSGAVLPSPEIAFRRLVQLALLKLDFVARGRHAKERGRPIVDLTRWGIDPTQIGEDEDDEDEDEIERSADTSAALPRSRRFWAGGYGEQARLQEFLTGSFWQIGWERDSRKPAARRTWARFSDVQPGDYFAIKGLGGKHDLVVRLVGEVTAVDAERGRVELRKLDVPLYKGKAPRGQDAGAWHDTLVPVTRPDAVESIFLVKPPPSAVTAIDLPLNLILYGPPGTGKTYKLRKSLMPQFTREPAQRRSADVIAELAAGLKWYEVLALVLHALGGRAKVDVLLEHPLLKAKYAAVSIPTALRQIVWGTLGQHTVESSTTVKMKRRLGDLLFDKDKDGTWFLAESLPDDLRQPAEQLRAPAAPGEAHDHTFITFHQAYGYEDFIEGIRPRVVAAEDDERPTLSYELEDGVFKAAARAALRLTGYDGSLDEFCRLPPAERSRKFDGAPPYGVFIDEINRGNVARIFGELITLLEHDKRLGAENEIIVTLPYSRTRFGVPKNLYVIGTMNTADRSVEALDAALRRRFAFEELAPRPELLDFSIEGDIDPEDMLRAINRRLEKLLDRDHCIGHAYLLPLKDDDEGPTLEGLKRVFKNSIIPLLQEYFFGDWGKIGLVLGKDFVRPRDPGTVELATFDHEDRESLGARATWELVDTGTLSNHAFRRIYEHVEEN